MTSPPQRPHWSTILLDGHSCELYDPPDAPGGRAIVYLHGAREQTLQESIGLCGCIEAAKIPALCPRAGRSWWIDAVVPAFDPSISPERFVVHRVSMEIERRFGVKAPGIALVGEGMGGQGALRLAYRHPAIFPVAAAIAPAVDFHLSMQDGGDLFDSLWDLYGDVERARQDTVILHVHPLNWPRHQWFASDPADAQWHDGSVRLHSKLNALGIPHIAILESSSGDHGIDFCNRMAPEAIRFVIEAFEKESRRIA